MKGSHALLCYGFLSVARKQRTEVFFLGKIPQKWDVVDAFKKWKLNYVILKNGVLMKCSFGGAVELGQNSKDLVV